MRRMKQPESHGAAQSEIEIREEKRSNGFEKYREDPAGFAREVLGSKWWRAQEEIAKLVAHNRRVAVKAANGVGKTFLAADLLLWFLYCHQPAIALTTAPTLRQVKELLWGEIRRKIRRVNALAELEPGRLKLEGELLQTKLTLNEATFAIGFSADDPVRFQGFHAENLLVILDEASGVSDEIWEAVEGICVGKNNRVIAISNPMKPNGQFYKLFHSSRWKTATISALSHPNVIGELGEQIPGAVTREAVEDRFAAWCELQMETTSREDSVLWEGKTYRPNPLFMVRVLGEFPMAGEDNLFARMSLERVVKRAKAENEAQESGVRNPCVIAVDVARFGNDETVIALRRGTVVQKMIALRGLNTQEVAGRVIALAREEGATAIGVDSVGVGGGVVDRLGEENLSGVVSINFGASPIGTKAAQLYRNLRAQTFWELKERVERDEISLPDDPILIEQLAALRYKFSPTGQIQIESKEEIRGRGLPSPDRADALALLFCPLLGRLSEIETTESHIAKSSRASPRNSLGAYGIERISRW